MKHLVPNLNRAILALSPCHTVADFAPSSFADVMQQHAIEPARLIVWSGGSEATIYGDPAINYAFRAWHDACHIAGQFAFDLEGERAACEMQVQQLLQAFPNCPAAWPAIIRAEVIGQAEFFRDHGAFPDNQFDFMRQYLAAQGIAI